MVDKFGIVGNFSYLCTNKKKNVMTQAELRYFELMPSILRNLVNEVSDLNKQVKELTEEIKNLKNEK